jgi:hypothetical protein
VSTFQQEMEVTLDGEVFKCRTKAVDFTNAERQLVREGGEVTKDQMQLRFRIAHCAFRRNYPDHPAKSFAVFLDTLDDLKEESMLEGEGDGDGDPLDPTPGAESDGSP